MLGILGDPRKMSFCHDPNFMFWLTWDHSPRATIFKAAFGHCTYNNNTPQKSWGHGEALK